MLVSEILPYPKKDDLMLWQKWCMELSDKLLEKFYELQKNTLLGDALLAQVNAVIYLIPIKSFGISKYQIEVEDILLMAVKKLSLKALKKMLRYADPYVHKNKLRKEFLERLNVRKINPSDFIANSGLQCDLFMPWIELGVRVPEKYEKIVSEWLILGSPYPLSSIQKQYFNQLLGNTNKIYQQMKLLF